MWGKDAIGPFHFIHSGFGIGTILGPLIVAPFLSAKGQDHNNTDLNQQMYDSFDTWSPQLMENALYLPTNLQFTSNTSTPNNTAIDITIPFAATGGCCVLISVVFFIYACIPFSRSQMP